MLNPLFSAEHRDKVLSYNPIVYWMLGEKVGTVAYDEVTDAGHVDTGQSGDHSVSSLGNLGIGDGRTSPEYDGTNDYTTVYTVPFRDGFNGAVGSVVAWAKVFNAGVWTDGTNRNILRFRADANNRIDVYSAVGDNRIVCGYTAGGTSISETILGLTSIDFMCFGMTWDQPGTDEFKAYNQGEQDGATQSGLGVWVGNLAATSTTLGAASTGPAQPWYGYVANISVFDYVLPTSAMGDLATV